MITNNLIPILILLVPALASTTFKWSNIKMATLISGIVEIILSTLLYFHKPTPGFFFINNISSFFIFMVASIYLISSIYSIKYLNQLNTSISEDLFFLLLNLFTISMLFTLEVNNFGLMWVGIESTTISSALLIIAEKNETSLEAAWRYIIIVSAGVTFAFISIILIYYTTGTLTVSTLIVSSFDSKFLVLAVAISLFGFGTKSGVFPVHTWLPDAHSEAPAPVSAMFSGVLLPVALYVMFMIYSIDPIKTIYVWIGTLSIVMAAIFLIYQDKYKRMFAYSTMENMNIALIGFALGGPGIVGALILLLSHSFSKAGAFYSAGNIFISTKSKKIKDVTGLYKNSPITAIALIFSSFGVSGIPPFGSFFGEIIIFYELYEQHFLIPFILVILSAVSVFISINYNVTGMVFENGNNGFKIERAMEIIALVSSVIPLAIGGYILILMGGWI
ncbi:MAG: proton-conducting transporter membrane subunit [Thermoplasmata archaeon]|jgi:hydrogenase-4 component F